MTQQNGNRSPSPKTTLLNVSKSRNASPHTIVTFGKTMARTAPGRENLRHMAIHQQSRYETSSNYHTGVHPFSGTRFPSIEYHTPRHIVHQLGPFLAPVLHSKKLQLTSLIKERINTGTRENYKALICVFCN